MRSIFYYIWFIYMYCMFKIKEILHNYIPQTKIIKKRTKSDLEKYSEEAQIVFFNTYKNELVNNAINGNIDDIFYNKEAFEKAIIETNIYEEKWKRNILIKTIPREDNKYINILMYYDVYKSGFAYYCDENSVSYNVLNNIAIKYVLTFHCRDFFVDESLFLEKEYEVSPLMEKSKVNKIKNNKNVIKSVNANKVSKEYICSKNKFIYLGKIRNFEILRKPIIKKTVNNYDKCFSNINYKDFKKKIIN